MEIDGYQIVDEIYRGPVTTVFKAIHLELDRIVLLKVLNTQWRGDSNLIERLRREAKICSRLDHPSIVRVFDFDSGGNSFYISMEYIPGHNLAEYILLHHPVPFASIISITWQTVNGLAFAHSRNALHRDMKPANIMISGDGRIKITDFGLATIADLPQITEQGQIVGSPAYMSPEQVRNELLDFRSDLFSLGATLYELCSGKSPFLDDNIGLTINNILNKTAAPLGESRTDIPAWFTGQVHGLMAKDKSKRSPVFDDFYHHLSEYQRTNVNSPEFSALQREQTNIKTKTSENPDRRRVKKRRHLSLTIGPFILLIVFIVIANYAEYEPRKTEQTKQPSLLSDEKNTTGLNPVITTKTKITVPSPDYAKPPGRADNAEKSLGEAFTKQSNSATLRNDVDLFGELYIRVTPWADIFIDSLYRETTPLRKSLILPVGQHTIELRNPNSKAFRRIVKVKPGARDTLFADLKPNNGFLKLQVVPWADVYINGEYLETTPLQNPISLPSGEHILTIKNPGFAAVTDTIYIKTGKTVNKSVKLK